ncbi:hypothetical protein Vadar_026021 [Vaccinium darrowii]|uniref:Uncharacterized protein n=1 Tax=Vaccinium darrowii TaxID=229202 RepID=A0ACB7XCW7_9ERIC|nr:hypothetical protein Vadar_026021 [Vaccinium darrowii]
MTEKFPRKESATMAPRTGSRVVQPLTTFQIWAASMLLTLNSLIMNTIKLLLHPPTASVNPATVAVKDTDKITLYMEATEKEQDPSFKFEFH